jgi:fluoroacetyl-CoA thioesterase
MSSSEPPQNATATAELLVTPLDLASALSLGPSDAFPEVFATARMVALMEIASARVLQPYLSSGQLSVGVRVEATHSAPTPLGATVTATSRYLGRDGKLFDFEIVASDAGGEIGRARHKRAIVDVERIQSTAARRIAGVTNSL